MGLRATKNSKIQARYFGPVYYCFVAHPYALTKIPVSRTLEGAEKMLSRFRSYWFCFYLAHKTARDWECSTSRIYMNQVIGSLIYLPIDVPKNAHVLLERIYHFAKRSPRVIAINHTQPHKSNPVLLGMLQKGPKHLSTVDILIKDHRGNFRPYDLNGPEFTGWYTETVGAFTGASVILNGVGGAGASIARAIARRSPSQLILVDPKHDAGTTRDKVGPVLTTRLRSISRASTLAAHHFIVINAAGKSGDTRGLREFLRRNRGSENVFVDIRPQKTIGLVQYAAHIGWRAHTGIGMNARNDYALLQCIARAMQTRRIPNFSAFERLVVAASNNHSERS